MKYNGSPPESGERMYAVAIQNIQTGENSLLRQMVDEFAEFSSSDSDEQSEFKKMFARKVFGFNSDNCPTQNKANAKLQILFMSITGDDMHRIAIPCSMHLVSNSIKGPLTDGLFYKVHFDGSKSSITTKVLDEDILLPKED